MADETQEELLTMGQLAKRARVSRSTVKRAKLAGRIVPVKEEDGEALFSLDAIEELSPELLEGANADNPAAALVEASGRAMREAVAQSGRAESDVRAMVTLLREGSRELLEQSRASFSAVAAENAQLRTENRALLDQLRDDRLEAFAQQKLEEVTAHKKAKIDQMVSAVRNVVPALSIAIAKKWPQFKDAAQAAAISFGNMPSTPSHPGDQTPGSQATVNPLASLGHVLMTELGTMTDEQFEALRGSLSAEVHDVLRDFRAQVKGAT